jgi:hypothetical protein
MTEIGRQCRQQSLCIVTLSIPLCQPVDREGVPEIVDAGLIGAALFPANARKVAQEPEALFNHLTWNLLV